MAENYSVEALTSDLFGELVPLMEDVFGGAPQAELFNWKYLRNPAGPATGYIARSAAGEVAAFYGMIPEIYRWGEKTQRIYQSCDTMTHSRHRRRGLFQLLARQTYAAAQAADPAFFAIGFSGPMSTPGFLKMGWANPFDIGHRFKPALLAHLGSLTGSGPEVQAGIPQHLFALMARNEAQRRNSKSYYLDFVAWRLSTPAIAYHYLIDDGAYAIFKYTPGFVYLLDFWEEAPGAGAAVIRSLNRAATLPGSRGLLTACQPGSVPAAMLARYMFLRNPFNRGPASEKTPFITYGSAPVPEAECSAGWQITAVDFDSL
jgi:hypothetical protein